MPGTNNAEKTFYSYTDETGTVVCQAVRINPKRGFYMRRPDGQANRWVKGLDGVERVLYNLPAVVKAITDGTTIYYAEGEKDADALIALGYVATTHCGGVNGWRDDYADTLQGAARVVFIADKDAPGSMLANKFRDAVSGRVGELILLEAKEGKDASDHLDARYGIEDFVPWVDRSSPEIPEVITSTDNDLIIEDTTTAGVRFFADVVPKSVSWIWRGWIPLGKPTVLDGHPKTGKSTIALDIAARVSTGAPFPDGSPGFGPARVIYLSAEDGLADTLVPRLLACGGDPKNAIAIDGIPVVGVDGKHMGTKALSIPRDLGFL